MRSEEFESSGPAEQKARGAFFTPHAIANFLAGWAIQSPRDTVLEPSCGDASFLIAAGEIAGDASPHERRLVGVELHRPSAEAAERRLSSASVRADVIVGDFFDFKSPTLFDVVLGNPPFIRYQSLSGESRTKGIEAALRQGVPLNRLASAWAAFLVHACGFLKPDGRLGMVLPAELLSVAYASNVRSYLMRRFSSLRIVTFERPVFPGVQEEIVLLLAAGSGSTEKFDLLQARDLGDLDGSLGRRWSDFYPVAEEKWTNAFVPDDVLEFYRNFSLKSSIERLGTWGRTYLGSVTGANEFFLLRNSEVKERNINKSDLVPVLPPGSRHMKGLELTKAAWECARKEDEKVYLFWPASVDLNKEALSYVESGAVQNVNARYKCKVRRPWWRVPLVEKPDLFISYMNHEGIRLVANSASVVITNSHYGFKLSSKRRGLGRELLSLAALNSLTMLGCEMEGRSYGGGLLKVEPREVDRIPVPSLNAIAEMADELRLLQPQVANRLRGENLASVALSVDEIVLRGGMGLSPSDIRDIREAKRSLLGRRIARNRRHE